MALRRTPRVWLAFVGRNAGPVVGTGQRPRNIQHAARDSLRRKNWRALRATDAFGRKAGAHLHLQQSSFRSGGARLRLRLLPRLPEHALLVGSAVWGFL